MPLVLLRRPGGVLLGGPLDELRVRDVISGFCALLLAASAWVTREWLPSIGGGALCASGHGQSRATGPAAGRGSSCASRANCRSWHEEHQGQSLSPRCTLVPIDVRGPIL